MSGTHNLSKVALEAHNHRRGLHKDTEDLKWDNNLANKAEQWANDLTKKGTDHSGGPHGENVYKKEGKFDDYSDVVKLAVEKWYGEISGFNFNDPENCADQGHFTQVVWKDATKVGMGCAQVVIGGKHKCIVVAMYDKGNEVGKYKHNVMNKTKN